MRKSGLTGDEAYALSKHRKTTEDLGPLKKEIGLIKDDLEYFSLKAGTELEKLLKSKQSEEINVKEGN